MSLERTLIPAVSHELWHEQPRARNRVAETVRTYFRAFEAMDRRLVHDILADDFRFSSPRDDRIGKVQYFDRCWDTEHRPRHFHIEKIFVKGPEAFVRYRAERTSDGTLFRNTELIQIENNRIQSIEVYFGRDLPMEEASELHG